MEISDKDVQFINEFNEYYPFERFIMETPANLDFLFDDAKLVEIFIPTAEHDGPNVNMHEDEIYIKLHVKGVEARFSYFDFSDNLREQIVNSIVQDFGDSEWESLYVEKEDPSDIDDKACAIGKEIDMAISRYGECPIKEGFRITSTINIVNDIMDKLA